MKKTVLYVLLASTAVVWLVFGYIAVFFSLSVLIDKWELLLLIAGSLFACRICRDTINHLGKRLWG